MIQSGTRKSAAFKYFKINIDKKSCGDYNKVTLQKEQIYYSTGDSSQLSKMKDSIWKGGLVG